MQYRLTQDWRECTAMSSPACEWNTSTVRSPGREPRPSVRRAPAERNSGSGKLDMIVRTHLVLRPLAPLPGQLRKRLQQLLLPRKALPLAGAPARHQLECEFLQPFPDRPVHRFQREKGTSCSGNRIRCCTALTVPSTRTRSLTLPAQAWITGTP